LGSEDCLARSFSEKDLGPDGLMFASVFEGIICFEPWVVLAWLPDAFWVACFFFCSATFFFR
jgi:hypothetical protein